MTKTSGAKLKVKKYDLATERAGLLAWVREHQGAVTSYLEVPATTNHVSVKVGEGTCYQLPSNITCYYQVFLSS